MEDPTPAPVRSHVIRLAQGSEILTDKRLAILRLLGSAPVDSVSSLAAAQGRRLDAVSKDLKILHDEGVIRFERSGRTKRPLLAVDRLVIPLRPGPASPEPVDDPALAALRRDHALVKALVDDALKAAAREKRRADAAEEALRQQRAAR